MKRILLTSALIFSFLANCFSQSKYDLSATSSSSSNPLFVYKVAGQSDILCNLQTSGFSLAAINQNSIKSMEILKDKTSTDIYGDLGKNGVIILTLTNETKLLLTDQLLKQYQISKTDRKLPVYLDSKPLTNLKGMYFDVTAIKGINVTTEAEGLKKYINIITIKARPETSAIEGITLRGVPGKFN